MQMIGHLHLTRVPGGSAAAEQLSLIHHHFSALHSHIAPCGGRPEEVEAVAERGHPVGVDSVVLRVAARSSRDVSTDVAALVQNIVGSEHQCGGFSLQEAVADLCIPNQFVGVEFRRAVATAAAHADVGAGANAVVQTKVTVCPIGEVVGVAVVGGHQLGTNVAIVQVSIHAYIPKVGSVVQRELLADGGVLHRILHRLLILIDESTLKKGIF